MEIFFFLNSILLIAGFIFMLATITDPITMELSIIEVICSGGILFSNDIGFDNFSKILNFVLCDYILITYAIIIFIRFKKNKKL